MAQLERNFAATPDQRVARDARTRLGTVGLTVSDVDRSRSFYEQAIGLRAFEQASGAVGLGVDDSEALIELHGDSAATPLDRRRTGLFHLAILVPTRLDLALALQRLALASWPLDGASDHLVSEALYLSDPDGNGIEIYCDRPREQWPRAEGRLQMATLPLDLHEVLAELGESPGQPPPMAPGTTIGHVHLQVSDLEASEQFYGGTLGFEVTVRGYPGALFLSAGGYHHHIGLNTWNSAGASRPPAGAVGLRSFEVLLPDARELEAVLESLRVAGITTTPAINGTEVEDPSGNRVLLRASG